MVQWYITDNVMFVDWCLTDSHNVSCLSCAESLLWVVWSSVGLCVESIVS